MSSECSKEDLPLVTIITATYNSNPQYLKKTIESVLEQTYPKIEYIITDDGSSVFHEELIHELLDTKNRGNVSWKIIRHDGNVGTVKNMNGAIRESHGEYIFGLAHDDMYYDANVISDWIDEFKKTGALVITARLDAVSNKRWKKSVFYSLKNLYDVSTKKIQLSSAKLFHNISVFGNTLSAPATAQSRTCFSKYGYYDEKYRLVEDYPRWIYLSEQGVKFEFWNRIVVNYRMGGISTNNSMNLTVEDEILNAHIQASDSADALFKWLGKIPIMIRKKIINYMKKNSYDEIHVRKNTLISIYLLFETIYKVSMMTLCSTLVYICSKLRGEN